MPKAASNPGPFVFKEQNVVLREPLHLTEKQLSNVPRFAASDLARAYVDVLPTTILVHKQDAQKHLDIKQCVYISSGRKQANLSVFASPKFCCCKPVDRAALCPLYNGFVNIEKCDLRVITAVDSAPALPKNHHQRLCCLCSKEEGDELESRLFSLPCLHVACRACWLVHAKWALAREYCPIPCPYGDCNEQLTLNRAAPLFEDVTLALMIELEWRTKLMKKDNIQCAGCKHWLQRNNFFRTVMSSGCACGCYTCVRCGQRDHTPLRCDDAAVWADIRSRDNEDEAATEAERVWSLTREHFDECLAPLKEIETDEYKNNLRFMKTHDRAHGTMLEKDMPMVARMLEMHRVQQFARRNELPATDDTYYGDYEHIRTPAMRWDSLEKQFYLCLDTLSWTREKAEGLSRLREDTLYYYNF